METSLLPRSWENPDSHVTVLLTHPWFKTLAKLQGVIYKEASLFFPREGLEALMLPVTTGSISSPFGLGSDSEPVSVELFGQKIFLSDSMQFLLEVGVRLRPDIKGVWYVMPSFRGEVPDSRHLNEFIHLEAEMQGDMNQAIDLVNSLIRDLSLAILGTMADEVKSYSSTLKHLEIIANGTYPDQITYDEACNIFLKESLTIKEHPAGFLDLTPEGEKKLIKIFNGPVWVTHHPTLRAPFYQKVELNTNRCLCADLLLGYGETVGLGSRQVTYDETLEALKLRRIDSASYKWYLEMKRLAPLSTSGFGMGLERFIGWVCQIEDIRHMQLAIRQKGIVALP